MTQDELARKNLDLLNEFMQFALETPDILDQIPPGDQLIILPENDPELYNANQAMLQALRQQGKDCTVVHIRKPERIPPRIEAAADRS